MYTHKHPLSYVLHPLQCTTTDPERGFARIAPIVLATNSILMGVTTERLGLQALPPFKSSTTFLQRGQVPHPTLHRLARRKRSCTYLSSPVCRSCPPILLPPSFLNHRRSNRRQTRRQPNEVNSDTGRASAPHRLPSQNPSTQPLTASPSPQDILQIETNRHRLPNLNKPRSPARMVTNLLSSPSPHRLFFRPFSDQKSPNAASGYRPSSS